MMDSICTYFRQNIESVTKEEILEALENALRSADCWRQACLLGCQSFITHETERDTSENNRISQG